MPFFQNLNTTQAIQIHQLLRQFTALLIGVLLVKMGMSKYEIGVYETLLFFTTALSFHWVSGLTNTALAIYPTLEKEQKKVFLFNAFFIFIVFTVLITSTLYLFASRFYDYLSINETLPFPNHLLLYFLFFFPALLIEFIYILKNENQRLIYFSIISNLINISLIVAFLFSEKNIFFTFIALFIYAVLRFIWLLIEIFRVSVIKIDIILIKSWLKTAFPAILYAFVGYAATIFDNWLVNFQLGVASFAIFRLGAREFPLFSIFLSGIVANSTQKAAINFEQTAQEIKQESRKLMHLLYPVCIILMFISPFLFEKIYSVEFKQSAMIFNIYLLLIINKLWITQPLLLAKKETKTIFYISIIELIINIIFSIIGIRFFGLVGVACGTVIAFSIEKILHAIFLKYKYNLLLSEYLDLKYYFFYNILLFLTFILVTNYYF